VLNNPLILIANYLFDSLPQDYFTVLDGQLYELLITTSTPHSEFDVTNPDLLNDIEIAYDQRPTSADPYGDPELDPILHAYVRYLTDTTFSFPNVALRSLRYFRALAADRLLLLSGDKGQSTLAELEHRPAPALTLHGSFSMSVNFHAIGEYFRLQGGSMLRTPHRYTTLNITASLIGLSDTTHPETEQAYQAAIVQGSPDDFFTLKQALENHYQTLTVAQILAYLRLSGWDSNIFYGCIPTLLASLESGAEGLTAEIYQAIIQVWETFYPIGEANDLAFDTGILLYGMKYYPEALSFFQQSVAIYGADARTLFNMAMCYDELRQWADALECLDQTLQLDPTFEPAAALRLKVEAALTQQS
jgi:tetratricopeptide (TPR) repeat protein